MHQITKSVRDRGNTKIQIRPAIRDNVVLRYKCPIKGGHIQEHEITDLRDFRDGKVIFLCKLCQNKHSFILEN